MCTASLKHRPRPVRQSAASRAPDCLPACLTGKYCRTSAAALSDSNLCPPGSRTVPGVTLQLGWRVLPVNGSAEWCSVQLCDEHPQGSHWWHTSKSTSLMIAWRKRIITQWKSSSCRLSQNIFRQWTLRGTRSSAVRADRHLLSEWYRPGSILAPYPERSAGITFPLGWWTPAMERSTHQK